MAHMCLLAFVYDDNLRIFQFCVKFSYPSSLTPTMHIGDTYAITFPPKKHI